MEIQPPKYALRFLRWFCREDFLEEIEGDLIELFEQQAQQLPRRANWVFFWRVLLYFRPDFIKVFSTEPLLHSAMIKHNLLITYRGYLRNKGTFLINLLGLSTGLACALFIFLWVQDEMHMDDFHEHDEQLFQVMQQLEMPQGIMVGDWAPGPLADALQNEFPEVKYAVTTKTHELYNGIATYEDQVLRASPKYAGEAFFQVFSYSLIQGEKDQVLSNKYATVISEDLAMKLFGSTEEAVGKTIEWTKKFGGMLDYSHSLVVSGVFANIPPNSTDHFDLLFTYELYAEKSPNVKLWSNDQAATAVVLKQGTNVEAFNEKLCAYIWSKREGRNAFFLQKYSSKYLYGGYEDGNPTSGRIAYVWLFSLIAFLVLVIASINFMNLSTAQASIRIKEIGVKKTLGAVRRQLIGQFVTESLLLSFLALLVAGVLVSLLLPQFNLLTGKELRLIFSPNLLMWSMGIGFFTGLLSSLYPALYLSGFGPLDSLKGRRASSLGELWMRKGLVVFQFTISSLLIFSMLVLYHQLDFIQTKNLGLDRDNIISLKKEELPQEKLESLMTALRALPEVKAVTNSHDKLIGSENFTWGIDWQGRTEDEAFAINVITANYDFLETFGIQLMEGRSFSREYGTETAKVILNQVAIQSMGLEDPIGQTITFWDQQVEIIGITEDFQYQSLYHPVQPIIIRLFGEDDDVGDRIWVKIEAGQEASALTKMDDIYQTFYAGLPFEYGFLDDEFEALYESETRVSVLSTYFAGVAILISCLGLFGLAAFTAERRTKEIGIRKILGSSVWKIISLLSQDFAKMVGIAILLALPIAYVVSNSWLDEFAYRIELEWWFFGATALITLLIAWVTVSLQTWRAARSNPAYCLRNE